MKKTIFYLIMFLTLLTFKSYSQNLKKSDIQFYPVNHASFIIESHNLTIYIDPVQDVKIYTKYPSPNIILITDLHSDHLNKKVIESIKTKKTKIIAPKAVISKLGFSNIINNTTEKK